MKLSILIGTIEERRREFTMLFGFLSSQIEKFPLGTVEVLFISDNKEISIGKKRQQLLEIAKGEYIVFIDDDDWISPEYIKKILAALSSNPDCVGFDILCTTDRGIPSRARASMQYPWAENVDGFRYVRSTYHKTPVRRDIAVQAGGFKDMRFGEDYDYSMRLKPLLALEVLIPEILYFYRYSTAQSHNQRYGIKD